MASTSTSVEPRIERTPARRLGCGLGRLALVFALASCGHDPALTTTSNVDDRFRVRVALFDLLDAIEAGDVDATLTHFTDDFLHSGDGRSAVAVWLRGLRAGAPPGTRLRARADEIEITVDARDGASRSATVRFHLTISDCSPSPAPEAPDGGTDDGGPGTTCALREDRTMRPYAPQSFAAHLRREGEEWRFAGDGRPLATTLLTDNEAGVLTLVARVRDPDDTATAISLRGDALVEVPLARVSPGTWSAASPIVLARNVASFPSLPLRYTLLVDRQGNSIPYTYEVEGIVRDYATPLAPSGESVLPVRFAWAASGPLSPKFQVRVYDGDTLLWLSREIFTTAVDYQGPTLVDGRRYRYEIAWLDAQGNRSRNGQSFVAVEGGTVTPSIFSLFPTSGPATGGQTITVTGANLRTGTQVLFGSAEASAVTVLGPTQIRCVTPAGNPGPVNVTLVDASGRTAVLRSAYVYLQP
jgi:hypothetical protein